MLFSGDPCGYATNSGNNDFDYEDAFNESDISNCNCTDPKYTYVPECDCDYPEAPPPSILEIVPPGIVYALVFLVGTVGNILVIFVVVHFKNMRNVTNIFLASLSTADLCLIWFCVPIQYMKYLSYTWNMGEVLCYGLHYVQQFSMVCSVTTLTVISVERYMAIAFPMKSMGLSSTTRVRRIIIIIWIVSAVLALPAAVKIEYTEFQTMRNKTATHCMRAFSETRFGDAVQYMDLIHSLSQFVLFLLIPLCTMGFCYARIACVVYRAAKEPILGDMPHCKRASAASNLDALNNSGTTNSRKPSAITRQLSRQQTRTTDANKKQIVQMLIMIVILCMFGVLEKLYFGYLDVSCWTPSIIDDLLIGFNIVCGQSQSETLKYMRMTFAAMAYTQSCLNPVVYAFMSKNFRQSFTAAWHAWTGRGAGGMSSGGRQSAVQFNDMSTHRRSTIQQNDVMTTSRRRRSTCTAATGITSLSPPVTKQRRATVESSNILENDKLLMRTSSPIPEEYSGVMVVVVGENGQHSNFV